MGFHIWIPWLRCLHLAKVNTRKNIFKIHLASSIVRKYIIKTLSLSPNNVEALRKYYIQPFGLGLSIARNTISSGKWRKQSHKQVALPKGIPVTIKVRVEATSKNLHN